MIMVKLFPVLLLCITMMFLGYMKVQYNQNIAMVSVQGSAIVAATLLFTGVFCQVYKKKREKKETSARWKYDLGGKRNFLQVFGTKKALWFLPMFSKDDLNNLPSLLGTYFPMRDEAESR